MEKGKDPIVGNVYYTSDEALEMSILTTVRRSLIKLNTHYTEFGMHDPTIDLVKYLNDNKISPFLEMVNKRIGQINGNGIDRYKKLNPNSNAI